MIRFLLLLLTTTAFAQLKDVDKQEFWFKNILKNPGFENGVTGWEKTGSAAFTVSTTTPGSGKTKGSIDFSATSEYFRSTAATIPQSLYGKNCLAKFRYNGGGTADIYYRVTDGTNTLAGYTSTSTSFKITSAVTTWTDSLDMSFPCPTSGSLKIEFESAGNAAALTVDDVYIGENFRVGTVAQANSYAGINWPGTTNCNWTRTSNKSWASYSADADCTGTRVVEGQGTTPGTLIPAITLNNMPPGEYMFVATGVFASESAGLNCMYRFSDGTTSSAPNTVGMGSTTGQTYMGNVSGKITFSTAGSRTIELQATGQNGNNSCAITNNQTTDALDIRVYRFPLAADTVVSAGVPNQGGTLNYAGTASCIWSSTAGGSFTAFGADTDCPTPTVSGNVQAPGTKIPGFSVASLEAGKYQVVVNGLFYTDASTTNCKWAISDGTTNSAIQNVYGNNTSASVGSVVAYFDYTSKQTNKTFQILVNRTGGSGNCQVYNADTTVTALNFVLIPLSPSITMPNLVNSVKSGSAGVEKIVRVHFGGSGSLSSKSDCTSSPCTIYDQSGSDVTSVTRGAQGVYAVNFASGTYASGKIPVCFGSTIDGGTANVITLAFGQTQNNSTVTLYTAPTSGGSAVDTAVDLVCVGPQP